MWRHVPFIPLDLLTVPLDETKPIVSERVNDVDKKRSQAKDPTTFWKKKKTRITLGTLRVVSSMPISIRASAYWGK